MADGAISGLKQKNSDDVTQNHLPRLRVLVSYDGTFYEMGLPSNLLWYRSNDGLGCVARNAPIPPTRQRARGLQCTGRRIALVQPNTGKSSAGFAVEVSTPPTIQSTGGFYRTSILAIVSSNPERNKGTINRSWKIRL